MRECHGETWDIEKLPRTASCASASIQRCKDFPLASEGRSVKGAVPGQEDGEDRGEGREDAIECKGREGGRKQYCPPHHVEAEGNGAKEGHNTLLHRTLAKGRECLGGERMADIPLLPLSGWRAFVLEGTKRLQD